VELLCLVLSLIAALASLALTPLVRSLALRVGFIDRPGPRKIHSAPVSYGGGIAVALALGIALGLGAFAWFNLLHAPDWKPLNEFLGVGTYASDIGLSQQSSMMRVLLFCVGGAIGALILGIFDDIYRFKPWQKLAGQFVLAIIVVAGGVRITALVGDNLAMQAATVLWIVLVTNSFNLLDNMDGLCSGTVAISAAALGLVAIGAGQPVLALTLFSLAGAALGFLRYNAAPASIFLGDAGSMFAGFLMATLSVVTTYFHYRESPLAMGVPLLVLAIPLYDTASVLTIRFIEKRRLFQGDNSHFSHRLVSLGLSRRAAVGTIHLAALAIALPATVIGRLSTEAGLILVGQALLILTVIALLEHAGLKRGESNATLPSQQPTVPSPNSTPTRPPTRDPGAAP